jgi:hypothetical protein
MPIPLGIFAVAGASAGALPAYEQIATQILSSNTASVTFSSIPSTYKHLEVRLTHREPSGNNNCDALIRLNGDTASNYSAHRLRTEGGSVNSDSLLDTYIRYRVPGTNLTGVWEGGILSILDYAQTTKNKTTRMLSGYVGGNGHSEVGLYSGSWRNTAAITSITFSSVNGNGIVSGSRFSLYGIKG